MSASGDTQDSYQQQPSSSDDVSTPPVDDGAPGSEDAYAVGGEVSDVGTAPATGAGDTSRQLAEQQERYLRLAAEYDNYRRRTMKERTESGARAQADLAKQLIEGLDDLARFAHVDPATVDAATVVQGAEMVEKKLMKALTAAGMTIVNPVNETFDPSMHEAVGTEPAAAAEDDHVVARVYQPAYLFNGVLLRPAAVVVKQWNG